jgi:hypothetical protein
VFDHVRHCLVGSMLPCHHHYRPQQFPTHRRPPPPSPPLLSPQRQGAVTLRCKLQERRAAALLHWRHRIKQRLMGMLPLPSTLKPI